MGVFFTSFIAWFFAQFTKFIQYRIENGRFNFGVLTTSGGMPSSHSALVVAATTRVALTEGILSPLFGACMVFSLVVMYDAAGVRQSVGEQAQTLNKIQEELKGLIAFDSEVIKEVLGHTGFQVFVGMLLGLAVGGLSIFLPLP
ncbi:MAG: divergent PAP2 family protein [Clostridia bacterium]|nr:divergent PAP2 family protein [Clostridia bacterium]